VKLKLSDEQQFTILRQGPECVVNDEFKLVNLVTDAVELLGLAGRLPCVTLKTTSSHEEGCTRRWNINTLEFLGENGKLTGVKVQEIDWKPNPEGGRPIMVEKGKPEIIKAELVLLAMGFLKPEHPEYPANVFVCGDAANGASLVVRAMASGKQTAAKVAAFLER